MELDLRDEIVDFVRHWNERTGHSIKSLLSQIGLRPGRYHDWRRRYGKVNEHNGLIPRDHWLEAWEKQVIVAYYKANADQGYRRLTYMLMDHDVVCVSPTTTYNVLRKAGLMGRRAGSESSRGKGFRQPEARHQHWHVDISYLNVDGTFYYLCSVLDGYSRFIVHHEIREQMKEQDVEIIIQRALERHPQESPRIISDNGPQFIARDFKSFVRLAGITHVRTSVNYPQSNGKIERWHQSLKKECIRTKTPISLKDARRIVEAYVKTYNESRLHSAIGYITPRDKLEGKAPIIFRERERKLAHARAVRARNRRASKQQHVA